MVEWMNEETKGMIHELRNRRIIEWTCPFPDCQNEMGEMN